MPATEEPQEPTSRPQEEQRSWWRRFFGRDLPSLPALGFETCVTFCGKVVLRAMVLGRLGGLFTPIQERVLYPSHRPLIESDRLFQYAIGGGAGPINR